MNTSLRARSERGSLLIVAMLFCAIIAVSLTSYLKMATTATSLSQRSFHANNAVNLAETGLELAMSSINSNSWGNWTVSGTNASRTFGNFTFDQGAIGSVKVLVQNYASASPTVVAKGLVQPTKGAAIEKWIVINGFISRSLFSKGLVGINGLEFRGNNPSVDSWDSRRNEDGTERGSPVGYSSAVDRDKGSIAAVNVTAAADVNNADIWGTASVGGSAASLVDVGPNGRVGPFGTPNGTKATGAVSTNFTTTIMTVTPPAPSASQLNVRATNINSDMTLPAAGDKSWTDADGKVWYVYQFPAMTGGNLTIEANKNVILLPTATSGNAIALGGNNDAINVAAGANLKIYTAAGIALTGQAAIKNANGSSESYSIQIYGTNTTTPSPGQTFKLAGNGSLMCACYAPNAAIEAKGGGNSGVMYGSFVGYTITLTGNDAFHYDEYLGRLGTTSYYQPTKWIELTEALQRAAYASYF